MYGGIIMSHEMKKERLLNIIERIERQTWEPHEAVLVHEYVSSLKSTIVNDFFTVVVLGEFKRGKSTFVNALLKTDLLPRDVTPTTATINSIMYHEDTTAQVVYTDGRTEDSAASLSFLNDFSVNGSKDTTHIEYIKIGLPADILKKKVILIDTPGVSDLNEQRVRVTYDFLPKADVVIFMLDATSPMKRTEKEFIEEQLLPLGLEKILFIANRFDEVDEEEEEEVLEDIQRRIISSFKENESLATPEIIPFSAKYALDGVLNNNIASLSTSYLSLVTEAVTRLIEQGTSSEERISHYTRRLAFGMNQLSKQLETTKSILNSSVEEIDILLDQIDEIERSEASRSKHIAIYVEEHKKDIQLMTQKSLNYYFSELQSEVLEQVDFYKGNDFKHFIEKQMVSSIRKQTTQWMRRNTHAIDGLLEKINEAIAEGLSRQFNTSITSVHVSSDFQYKEANISVSADDLSGVTTKAGLIVGGAAGLLALAGGGILTPLVGFAGFPYLQKTLLEQKLQQAKENVIPELITALKDSKQLLLNELDVQLEQALQKIVRNNELQYEELLNRTRMTLEADRNVKNNDKFELTTQRETIEQKEQHLVRLALELNETD